MNLDRIEKLIRLVKESTATEVAVESGDCKLLVRKHVPPAPVATHAVAGETLAAEEPAATPVSVEMEPVTIAITAPMVGIYRDARQPLAVDDPVEVGHAVGSIEVMKLPNEVCSEWDGIVVKVLVEDGQPVEYGQHLFELVPAQAMTSMGIEEG